MNNASRISLRHLNSSSLLKQSKYAVLSSVFESLLPVKCVLKFTNSSPQNIIRPSKYFQFSHIVACPRGRPNTRTHTHSDRHTPTVIKKNVTDSELVSCKRALTHTQLCFDSSFNWCYVSKLNLLFLFRHLNNGIFQN